MLFALQSTNRIFEAAGDAYVAQAVEGSEAPAFDRPLAETDLDELQAIAADLRSVADRIASHVTALQYGTEGRPVDPVELARSLAESLDPHLTGEALGVLYAAIRSEALQLGEAA